jgi:hypothetical protein
MRPSAGASAALSPERRIISEHIAPAMLHQADRAVGAVQRVSRRGMILPDDRGLNVHHPFE